MITHVDRHRKNWVASLQVSVELCCHIQPRRVCNHRVSKHVVLSLLTPLELDPSFLYSFRYKTWNPVPKGFIHCFTVMFYGTLLSLCWYSIPVRRLARGNRRLRGDEDGSTESLSVRDRSAVALLYICGSALYASCERFVWLVGKSSQFEEQNVCQRNYNVHVWEY